MNPIHLVWHSDDWVSGRIHGWRPPRWIQVWMVASTRLGDGWAWLAMVMIAPARGDGRAAHTLAETIVAIVAVNAAQVALKRAFRRPRPAGPVVWWNVHAPDQFSFPSGHTMNAFAVATLVTVHVPVAAPVAFAIAASVGASRVVLELHYASDVAAGATLGTVLASGATLLMAA
jgi:undecaprenyl-diphosphatase